MKSNGMSEPNFDEQARVALAEYLVMPQDELLKIVSKTFQNQLGSGGLAGATGWEAVERFYEQKLKPSVDLLVARNIASAKAVAAVLEDKSPEITSAGVALVANYLAKVLEIPAPNESRLLFGFAAILLMVGMKARKKHGEQI